MAAKTLRFTKMHGAGNDYVYIDAAKETLPTNDHELQALARKISDRHTGVGGDGLILIMPPTTDEAQVRMRMFNIDGSEGRMCGNGIRCVAKFAVDHALVSRDAQSLTVETASGLREIHLVRAGGEVTGATVDMGQPLLGFGAVNGKDGATGVDHIEGPSCQLRIRGGIVVATLVSMGNPHAVVFVDELARVELQTMGPAIASHEAFADEINAHCVQVLGQNRVRVLHWERGSGVTLACGTGACAVAVASHITGRTGRAITAEVPGGELSLNWDEASNHVHMTGPAVDVFSGTWVP